MPKKSGRPEAAVPPSSFRDCLSKFLTPALFRQAHRAAGGRLDRCHRWGLHPLVLVLLFFTWAAGDSQEERFEAARAAYVRLCPKRRRPGGTVQGFRAALARLPVAVLRALAAALRLHLLALFGAHWAVQGWVPVGVDGSRLECPASEELQARAGQAAQPGHTCDVWVTALVHLSTGLLWSWRLGKADASEREHLSRLLPTLPPGALLMADAGFQGFELAAEMVASGVHFLIRASSQTTLYAVVGGQAGAGPGRGWSDGQVVLWPNKWHSRQPLLLRLLRVKSPRRKRDVWLLTNVMEPGRLSLGLAGRMYQLRWENELFFRTFKRTMRQVKLQSRAVRQLHREAYGALLAAQVLLAQGAWALLVLAGKRSAACSPRQVLREIRREMRGDGGKRKGDRYVDRLKKADRERRERTSGKEKRRWPQRRKHKQPGAPQVRPIDDRLKRLIGKHFSLL